MSDRERQIAFHEAGHALMAVLMGREVRSVSLTNRQTVLNSERLGVILSGTGPLSSEDQKHCEEELKIALAGYGGEVVGLGKPSFLTAYDDDIRQGNVVHRALRERAGRKGTGNDLQADVTDDLERNRPSLDRIAEALIIEGEIRAERVRELVGPLTAAGD